MELTVMTVLAEKHLSDVPAPVEVAYSAEPSNPFLDLDKVGVLGPQELGQFMVALTEQGAGMPYDGYPPGSPHAVVVLRGLLRYDSEAAGYSEQTVENALQGGFDQSYPPLKVVKKYIERVPINERRMSL
jgi:hypothetical protein